MEYKSQIIENLTPDLIQLGATNANPQVATLIVSKENENVSVGEIQGGTFISKFMVKSNSSSDNQIVLQHSGNGVPIVGIGQESSHGSLQLRLNSGTTQVRLSAINNNYIIPSLGVGGVTSPNAKLHIAGGSAGMFLSNLGDNSAYDSIKMSYTGYNSGTPEFCFTQTSTPGSGIANTFYRFKNTNGAYGTNPNNTANVTIGGILGIGEDNPGAKLDIVGDKGGVSVRVKGSMSTAGSYYYGYMYDGGNVQGTTQSNIFYAGGSVKANTTITDWASFRIDNPSVAASGAVITNNYGIYQASTVQKNFFAGNVNIGTIGTGKLNVAGTVVVGNSGTSRFTDTSAFPLQLNRGLNVDVFGANGCILGLGTLKGTTYKDGARISGGLEVNGTDGNFSIQTLGSSAYSTAITLNSVQAVRFDAYGAGTLVTDASGNITASSGGGAGGPFLPLAGGNMDTNSTISAFNIGSEQIINTTSIDSNTFDAGARFGCVPGSKAAPAYTFTADLDTGMFRDGTNTLAFTAGGAQMLTMNSSTLTLGGSLTVPVGDDISIGTSRINSSGDSFFLGGDVGIGMSSPDVALHVTKDGGSGSGLGFGTAKFINTNTGNGATTMHIVQTSLPAGSNFSNAVKFWSGSTPTAVGFIRLTSSTTIFITTASDLNLKKNITNWDDNTLDKFKALQPKKFRFKSQDVSEDKTLGFIAQNEVNNFPEAYPQFTGEDEKPYYGFNPSGMTTHLMKAIKDLVEKVEILENKITQLEN